MLSKIVSSMVVNRELVRELAVRELNSQYKGAFLGSIWLILNPLIQTGAYVIIVSFVFRTGSDSGSNAFSYALYVLSGMVPWQILTRSLMAAPDLIRERIDLVKQVIFPIEILPLSTCVVSSCGSIVSLLIFLILGAMTGGLNWTCLLLPIPVIMLLAFIIGVSWAFMIVGVVVKDLREIVSVCLGLLVFLSPVVVSETIVGPNRWRYILLNPLAHVVICFRDVFNGEFHSTSWILFALMSAVSFVIGAAIVTRAKVLINEYI